MIRIKLFQSTTLLNDLEAPTFYSTLLYYYGPAHPGSYVAYIEAWGLYAEHLGHEMGMYEMDQQVLGYYSFSLLRAARLVVDTGIHSMGWSKEKAVEYFMKNTFLRCDICP